MLMRSSTFRFRVPLIQQGERVRSLHESKRRPAHDRAAFGCT